MFHFEVMISFLIFCMDDLAIDVNVLLKLPTPGTPKVFLVWVVRALLW